MEHRATARVTGAAGEGPVAGRRRRPAAGRPGGRQLLRVPGGAGRGGTTLPIGPRWAPPRCSSSVRVEPGSCAQVAHPALVSGPRSAVRPRPSRHQSATTQEVTTVVARAGRCFFSGSGTGGSGGGAGVSRSQLPQALGAGGRRFPPRRRVSPRVEPGVVAVAPDALRVPSGGTHSG